MRLFALTGAGVSAESGLGTFRDKKGEGIWARFDPIKLATPEAFARDPASVQAFYDARRRNLLDAEPNGAHVALAELERQLAARGGELTLVTQNIDDLHERAGSQRVIHMHGELLKARCLRCDAVLPCRDDLGEASACAVSACAACKAEGALRPHVVWFGEVPLHMEEIYAALVHADRFVAIGTSGSVYPAAGFVAEARALGLRTCELNLEPSDNAYLFDERHYGKASEAVAAWAQEIIEAL
ncbi:NAD-dependent deacylase [Methylocystis bryophila]|uniref:NAD-dependent protein deacylase n=1 Tax=Methylocystis bryophila TaxID=655015 RepID=A0A1W6MVZ8_9HYPH|nr:NAD-dependent deacylase [Methylocystis bryophila]ARN81745.1 NAD-dependent protein deacylase [Methylocystis bryophila]BDV37799.1 NAD-dependent protein deacylase [Methylocystis bryophila]